MLNQKKAWVDWFSSTIFSCFSFWTMKEIVKVNVINLTINLTLGLILIAPNWTQINNEKYE